MRNAAQKNFHAATQKRYRENNWFKSRCTLLLGMARRRAIEGGLDFDLPAGHLHTLEKECALTGLDFKPTTNPGHPHTFSPSLDRKDQSGGYTIGNVRLVLYGINSFKGVGTDEEMLDVAESLLRMQRPHLFKDLP